MDEVKPKQSDSPEEVEPATTQSSLEVFAMLGLRAPRPINTVTPRSDYL